MRIWALFVVQVGRLIFGLVPVRRRGITVSRLVNLAARILWEAGPRWLPKRSLRICRLASGAQLELDLSERIQGQVVLTGAYEQTLVDAIAAQLPADGVFLDVGGNVGLVTFEVVGRTRDRSPSVHVFEPHPDNVAALRRNLALNPGAPVAIVDAALGASVGSGLLGESPNPHESGWHRIVSSEAGPPTSGTISVPVTTIDEYTGQHGLEHVDVLKIDVEGLEADVLEGAKGLLSRRAVDLVILEMSLPMIEATGGDPDRLYEVMVGYGYKPTVIPSTSPTRMIPRTRHLAAEDVAFHLATSRGS